MEFQLLYTDKQNHFNNNAFIFKAWNVAFIWFDRLDSPSDFSILKEILITTYIDYKHSNLATKLMCNFPIANDVTKFAFLES